MKDSFFSIACHFVLSIRFLSGFDENFNDRGSSDYELMTIDTIINGKVIQWFNDFEAMFS